MNPKSFFSHYNLDFTIILKAKQLVNLHGEENSLWLVWWQIQSFRLAFTLIAKFNPLLRMSTPTAILDLTFERVASNLIEPIIKDSAISKNVEFVCRNPQNCAGVRLLPG